MIVPTDESDAARRALALALELGARSDLDVHLLHVHAIGHGDAAGMAQLSREAVERAALDASRRAFGPDADSVPAERRQARWGEPVAEIIDFVRRHEPALVVMGRGQEGTLERLLLGSVSDGVLRHCRDVPVTFVR